MKLIIQIPCLNEEKTLPQVLKEIPKKFKGIDKVEIVVIDDGSTDRTGEVARKFGCHVITHKENLGLGLAFKHGLQYALENGADILINTDADNQYPSKYMHDLIEPVVANKADMVIGDRQTQKIEHFSGVKKFFQRFGSGVVRRLSGTNVPDTVSGFRAYSRDAMYALNVTTKFSYVLDTIMQVSKKNLTIMSVPIRTNKPTRESRLFKNMFQHMYKSGWNMLRIYTIYEPFRTFLFFSLLMFIPGFILGLRFVIFYLMGDGSGHLQSLIATAILLLAALILFVLGIIAELLKTNRMIIEEHYNFTKKQMLKKK